MLDSWSVIHYMLSSKHLLFGAITDWAKEDFCKECKEEYGVDREEDLPHALWNLPGLVK